MNTQTSSRQRWPARALAWIRERRLFREGHAWHGLQLIVAIALAYGATRALGLPEGQWAVMSTLIVGRADAGATLSAGWQRLGATVGGACVGMLGAALMQARVAPPELVTLALVSAVAFATADRIGWRSASIAALIVMTAAGRPGVSALAVAGLRTAEVGLGAAAAMATAWIAHRLSATPRPLAVVAQLLRELATQVEAAIGADVPTRLAHSAAVRATQRRLGEMVHGTQDPKRRGLLLLTMRLAQDAAWLARQAAALARHDEALAREAVADVSRALAATASRLGDADGDVEAALAALTRHTGPAWQADAVEALQTDLRKLAHLAIASGPAAAS